MSISFLLLQFKHIFSVTTLSGESSFPFIYHYNNLTICQHQYDSSSSLTVFNFLILFSMHFSSHHIFQFTWPRLLMLTGYSVSLKVKWHHQRRLLCSSRSLDKKVPGFVQVSCCTYQLCIKHWIHTHLHGRYFTNELMRQLTPDIKLTKYLTSPNRTNIFFQPKLPSNTTLITNCHFIF
jgi:hypothetical protein